MREAINFDVQMCTQMWSQPNSPSVHGKGVCVYPDSHPETPLNYRTMHKIRSDRRACVRDGSVCYHIEV